MDEFEKMVLAVLFFSETHPRIRKRIMSEMQAVREQRRSSFQVGDLIYLLSLSTSQLYENRHYFSAKANLVKHGLVKVSASYDEPNVMNMGITISHEIVNAILGDKNDYYSNTQYLEIETPAIALDDVILDEETKNRVKSFLDHRAEYRKTLQESKLERITSSSFATTFLFYGPSGTGKTMLAKAIANYLNKVLMTVDFKEYEESRSLFERHIPLKNIFQKAETMDAVLLLDECDDLFKESSRNSRTLLIEMERTNAIVILATNEVRRLDPAIDRRISLKVKFTVPDASMRKKLWEIHLPAKKMLAEDVDTDGLARKFFFPGGFIKNAVVTALHNAMEKRPNGQITICQEDLLKAGKSVEEQMLKPLYYSNPHYPSTNLNEIRLRPEEIKEVEGIIQVLKYSKKIEKPPRVLFHSQDMQKLVAVAEAIATSHSLPINFLPTELFYNDKSVYFLKAHSLHGMGYEAFLLMVIQELNEMDSILVLADEQMELMKKLGDKKVRIIDLLYKRITQLQKPILVLTDSPNINPHTLQNYFDFVVKIDAPEKEHRMQAWEKLLLKDIALEKSVNIAALAEQYVLSENEISEIIDTAVKRFYFYGLKNITQTELENIIHNLARRRQGTQLFGNSK